jgi:ribosomal protein L37AE/L43A
MTDKPSSNEEEYFLKQDAELVKQMRARLDAERKAAERKSHYMKCPKCGADLQERVTNQVAVDVCSECGGMWLDAGELELLRKVKEHRFASLFQEIFRSLPGK